MSKTEHFLKHKIRILNEKIWENRARDPEIEDWLSNFDTSASIERLQALFLLSNFMYFGNIQMRELLKSMYRDLYKYPIIEKIRKENNDTTDVLFIKNEFENYLGKTRFLGVGNPSESGYHLLYYFRQENRLPKDLFIHAHKIFKRDPSSRTTNIRNKKVNRYVFIDDISGSGEQGVEYSEDVLFELKNINKDVFVAYYLICATEDALDRIRNKTLFDSVQCIYTLDSSFKCFSESSRIFSLKLDEIEKEKVKEMSLKYGLRLCPAHPLGYENCELLIGFQHNIPDNTLPIIWYDNPEIQPWKPIFRRYPKIKG